jgi:hypothetical protein
MVCGAEGVGESRSTLDSGCTEELDGELWEEEKDEASRSLPVIKCDSFSEPRWIMDYF